MESAHRYKWYLLALVMLTNLLVVGIPSMALTALSKEISTDLSLNVVQVGVIWGVGMLPALFTSLLAGIVGDQLGPRRVIVAGVLVSGLLGAGRGLAPDYLAMVIVVLVSGAAIPFVTTNGLKTVGMWFPSRQLGLATGMTALAMATGFLIGSLFSATLFSPLLGGWRNVFAALGLLGALMCVPWYFTRSQPAPQRPRAEGQSLRAAVTHITSLRSIWLLGWALCGVGGSVQGLLGYLPLYLRDAGWDAASASGALSAFHTSSMLFVLPAALWSDRLGSRKRLLQAAALITALGCGLLSVASGGWIWGAVLLSGAVRDAFMALFLTMVVESEGVGPAYAGAAVGFVLTLSSIGSVLAPPLGNSLAAAWPGAPFLFWAALAGLGCLALARGRAPAAQARLAEQ